MNLSPLPLQKFFDNNGRPLVGGQLFTYVAGTTTKIGTYTDSTGSQVNTNPIELDYRGEANVWLDPTLTYKFTLAPKGDTDPPTRPIWTVDQITSGMSYAEIVSLISSTIPTVVTQEFIGQVLYPRTQAEINALVTPAEYHIPSVGDERYGAMANNANDDTLSILDAINVAKQSINGAIGNVVEMPLGTSITSSEITLPNNVRFQGTNKNGSIFKASPAWNSGTSPYMFLADNGASSMFDSLLEDLTIDCNNIAGLGCVQSNAWQENSGPRRCLLYRFTTYGILYSQTGYATSGGAAFATIEDTEMFAATNAAAIAGIKLEQISSVGTFVLNVNRCTIAGGAGFNLPRGIDIVKDSSRLEMVHFENAVTGIYLDGLGDHTIINCTGDTTVTNLIEIAATFTGTVTLINCRRGGTTNFLKDNRAGGYGTISSFDYPFMQILPTGTTSSKGVVAENTARAWCVFDGTVAGTNAPTRGFNVTSITRNSAGDYTVTLTNALISANAVLSVMTNLDTADLWAAADLGFGSGSANFTIRRGGAFAGAKVDCSKVMVSVFGSGR